MRSGAGYPFESELFGHVKGSFTGADRDRVGLVEEAHLGTAVSRRVAETSPAAQVKLLRFLQERTFSGIGENVQRTVNVRIIAATNKDLQILIAEKKFRETSITGSTSSASICRRCATEGNHSEPHSSSLSTRTMKCLTRT